MSFLLDTNVISEWVKLRPNAGVIRWLADADEDEVFISVISIAEISRGLELMPKGHRRDGIAKWLSEDLPARFAGRILLVHLAVAQEWGATCKKAHGRGYTVSIMDGFLSATARIHDLTLVTRNTKDFQGLGLTLLNPWTDF